MLSYLTWCCGRSGQSNHISFEKSSDFIAYWEDIRSCPAACQTARTVGPSACPLMRHIGGQCTVLPGVARARWARAALWEYTCGFGHPVRCMCSWSGHRGGVLFLEDRGTCAAEMMWCIATSSMSVEGRIQAWFPLRSVRRMYEDYESDQFKRLTVTAEDGMN